MALIVEDGSGKANAESYASVAAATIYHANFGNAAWDNADSDIQESALRRATSYIDTNYRFKGERHSAEQALSWPRYGVVVDGYELAEIAIPSRLVHATCELALRALTGGLMDDVAAQYVESVKVGPIERTMSAPANGGQRRFAAIDSLLRDLVRGSSGNSVTVVRA